MHPMLIKGYQEDEAFGNDYCMCLNIPCPTAGVDVLRV